MWYLMDKLVWFAANLFQSHLKQQELAVKGEETALGFTQETYQLSTQLISAS